MIDLKVFPMDHLELPNALEWERRRNWFEAQFDIEKRGGAYILGEHASALLIDLQSVFCAGAYISAIILACTIVDAHLREVEAAGAFKGGIEAAFSELTLVAGLDWLRHRRNKLIHFKKTPIATITLDDQWQMRSAHEVDARRAVELVAAVLFEHPWL